MVKDKILTIDPGLSKPPTGGTGYCVYNGKDSFLPERTGILVSRKFEWGDRANDILDQIFHTLSSDISEHSIEVYIEYPLFFSSNKGMTCATGKDGGDSDLVKLAFFTGRLYELFYAIPNISVHLLRVNEWKGTMSKQAVQSRIERRLKLQPGGLAKLGIKSHAVDAVGMNLWVQGKFQANSSR